MTPDIAAAVLINDLDSAAHHVESLPAHPRYTDALVAVQAAKQALIDGRSDLHQRDMKERFAKTDATAAKSRRGDALESRDNEVVPERRVPRFSSQAQQRVADYNAKIELEPWYVGNDYFKTYNVSDDFVGLFWSHHSDLSTGDFILRTHVVSRSLPRVLLMCYSLDDGNDSWTLNINRCPDELRKYYPSFPLKYSPKEWDEGGIRETWYKKLYYWMEDASEYRLRHAAQSWYVEERK